MNPFFNFKARVTNNHIDFNLLDLLFDRKGHIITITRK